MTIWDYADSLRGRLHEGPDAHGELLEGPTFEGRLDE